MYIDLNNNPQMPQVLRVNAASKSTRAPSKTPSTQRKDEGIMLEDIYEANADDSLLIFIKMPAYSYLGEEDIVKKKVRSYSAVCLQDCELYTLDRIEIETIIREEYPLIYERLVKTVLEKDHIDYNNKLELIDIYQKFADVDEGKIANTLTVQDMRCLDDVPDLRWLYEEALVHHPVEVLLNTFDSENGGVDSSNQKQYLSFEQVNDQGIQDLYDMLKGSVW